MKKLIYPADDYLWVVHEENLHEEEKQINYAKSKYWETKDHLRVLERDIKLDSDLSPIIIDKETKEKGIYPLDWKKVPKNVNALLIVGKINHGLGYIARYALLQNIRTEKNS